MKRFVSLLLALVLVIGSIPALPVMATEEVPAEETLPQTAEPETTQATEPVPATEPEETEAPVTEPMETEPSAPSQTEPAVEETIPETSAPGEESYSEEVPETQNLPEGLQYSVNDNIVTITGYTGTADTLTIPDTIAGLPVTAIGPEAFYDNNHLVSVVLPNSLKRIENDAFHSCQSLKQVNLPDGLTYIGNRAFAHTTLFCVFFPTSMEEIGSGAFDSNVFWHALYAGTGEQWNEISIHTDNQGLRNASMHFGAKGDEVKEIYKQDCTGTAISHCDLCGESLYTDEAGLHTYVDGVCTVCGMPAGLMYELETNAASPYYRITGYVGSAKDLVIPATIMRKNVERIEDYAFRNNTKLQSVTMPDSIRYVGWGAFEGCATLTRVELSRSLKEISNSMFTGCAKLTDIELHEGIYSIGMRAFAGCSSLRDIRIPDTVQDISDSAFAGCRSLTQITLPAGLRYLSSGVFADCTGLKTVNIPENVTCLYGETFLNCRSLIAVNIPETVTRIGWGEFEGCTNLRAITIPAAVGEIMPQTFAGCDQLWHVLYTGTQEQWNALEPDTSNEALNKATVHFGAQGNEVIPFEETTCTTKAMLKCEICDEILYDESFVGEHDYVDGVCTVCGDGEVTIPGLIYETGEKGVTITDYTGTAAELEIPATIGGKPVTTIGEGAFADCVALKKIILPQGITTLESNAFAYCYVLTEINIPDTVTTIGAAAFMNCEKLTAVTIPNGVERIEEDTFFNCYSLKTVVLPDGLTHIGNYAFGSCYVLTGMQIPGTVTHIGDYAFRFCKKLTALTLPSGLDGIREGAFSGCHSLQRIVIPDSVQKIGTEAFFQCTAMGSVTLPASVTVVEKKAFTQCDNLRCVVYGGTGEQMDKITVETGNTALKDANWHVNGVYCTVVLDKVGVHTTGKPELRWADLSCMKGYEIYRATSAKGTYTLLGTTDAPYFVDESAQFGTKYYYKLAGINSEGALTAKSSYKSGYCCCAQPEITAQSPNRVPVISWEKVENATKYEIWRSETSHDTYKKVATTSKLTYTDTNAPKGKVSYYKVRAIASNSSCSSNYSNIESTGYICAGPVVKLTLSAGAPSLTWSKISGASGYDIYRGYSAEGPYTLIHSQTALSFKDTTAPADTECFYKVIAVAPGEGCNSPDPEPVSVFTTCITPAVTAASDAVTGKPVISWKAVAGAVNYEVSRSGKSSGTYTVVSTTSELSFLDETAAGGKTYYYKVTAITAKGTRSAASAYKSAKSICAAPVIDVHLDAASGKPTVSWEAVDGAKKYDVYRASSETGKYSKVKTVTTLSYTDTKATVGKTYYYKAKAVASSSTYNSVYSQILSCKAVCAQPAFTVKVNAATGKPELSWKKVTGASQYEILRAMEANGEYTTLSVQKSLTYKDTAAVTDTTYFYKINALAAEEGNNSVDTIPVSVTAACAQPVITTASDALTGTPVISWKTVEGAATYEITRSTKSGGTYEVAGTTDALSFVDDTVAGGKTYYYKVTAITAKGTRSAASAYKSAKSICAAPVIAVQLDAASGKPSITWNAVDGAKKYDVYRATSETGKYSKLTTTTKLTYTDTKASVGKTYFYKVKAAASSSSYNSVYSQILSCKAVCAQPAVTVKINTTTGKPELSWKKITGASQYEILRATEENGTYTSLSIQKTLSYKDTTVPADTVCYYKVNAIAANAANNSIDAEPKAVVTTCAKPVIKTAAADEVTGKPRITWEAVEGAVSYEITRAVKKNGTYTAVGTVTECTFLDETAEVGKTCYYKVIAVGVHSRSAASAYKSVKCLMAAPVLTVELSDLGNAYLYWTEVDGAAKYEVYRSTSETSGYTKIKTTMATNTFHILPDPQMVYYFKIRAVTDNGTYSPYSAPVPTVM